MSPALTSLTSSVKALSDAVATLKSAPTDGASATELDTVRSQVDAITSSITQAVQLPGT